MSITLNDNIYIAAGKPSEPKYLNASLTAWSSLAAVKAGIPIAYRSEGLVVKVSGLGLYWFDAGVADVNLVPYASGIGSFLPATIGGTSSVSSSYEFKYNDGAGNLSSAIFGNNLVFQSSDSSDNYSNIYIQPNFAILACGDGAGTTSSEIGATFNYIYIKTTIAGFSARLDTSALDTADVVYSFPKKASPQVLAMTSDIPGIGTPYLLLPDENSALWEVSIDSSGILHTKMH